MNLLTDLKPNNHKLFNTFLFLQYELKKYENSLLKWTTLAHDLLDVDGLDQFRTKIEDMRKEELKLRDELGSLTLELNSMNRYVPYLLAQFNGISNEFSEMNVSFLCRKELHFKERLEKWWWWDWATWKWNIVFY